MKYKIEYKHEEKDFQDVLKIEKQYFESNTIASVNQVIKWDNKNNDIHIFIRDIDADKIIGEITMLPLSEKQFNKFMQNELKDTDIDTETLLNYDSINSCYLLISAIAIDSKYRDDKRVLSLLLEAFNHKINFLIKNGIKFLNMCAEGQTLDGQKFIQGFLNLKYQKLTKEGYKLYSFNNTQEFDNWLKIFPVYISNYNINNDLQN